MRLPVRPTGRQVPECAARRVANHARRHPLSFRGDAAEPQRRGGSPRLPMVRGTKCVLGRKTGLKEFSHG